MVSCDVCDIGMLLEKKWSLGGETKCVKDVNIRGHFLEAKNPCFVTKNC